MTEGNAAASAVVATDAGMLALWSGAAFDAVDSYEDWESKVNERLDEAIAPGEMVPVGIQGDGAFAVRVATAPSGLTDREQRFAVVTSDPYLLSTPGGQTFLTGVESVGDCDNAPSGLVLAPGRYAVRVTLVAWDDEPGAKGARRESDANRLAGFRRPDRPRNRRRDLPNRRRDVRPAVVAGDSPTRRVDHFATSSDNRLAISASRSAAACW